MHVSVVHDDLCPRPEHGTCHAAYVSDLMVEMDLGTDTAIRPIGDDCFQLQSFGMPTSIEDESLKVILGKLSVLRL